MVKPTVIRWALGTKVMRCPFCGRPMSYRDGRPFCRCRLRLQRKEYRLKKGGKEC